MAARPRERALKWSARNVSRVMKTAFSGFPLFPAQAAVVVGGTSLAGGKGGVLNTVVGVLIMTVLSNGLVLMSVNPYIRTGIEGVIILVAVALTIQRSRQAISK